MRALFYMSCVSGLQEVAAGLVSLAGGSVKRTWNDSLLYQFEGETEFTFANECAQVLLNVRSSKTLKDGLGYILSDGSWLTRLESVAKARRVRSFSIALIDGQARVAGGKEGEKLALAISKLLGIVQKEKEGELALQVVQRHGECLFLAMISRHDSYEGKPLDKRPDFCQMLASLSGARGKEVLDAYCARGTLTQALVRFGCRVVASDTQANYLQHPQWAKGLLLTGKVKFSTRKELKDRTDGFAAVIAMPPQGHISAKQVKELYDLVKVGGRLVLLSRDDTPVREAVDSAQKLSKLVLDEAVLYTLERTK